MRESGSSVTISWPDYQGAMSGKAVTFQPDIVAKFKRNDSGKTFELIGKTITPDFIYIE